MCIKLLTWKPRGTMWITMDSYSLLLVTKNNQPCNKLPKDFTSRILAMGTKDRVPLTRRNPPRLSRQSWTRKNFPHRYFLQYFSLFIWHILKESFFLSSEHKRPMSPIWYSEMNTSCGVNSQVLYIPGNAGPVNTLMQFIPWATNKQKEMYRVQYKADFLHVSRNHRRWHLYRNRNEDLR